MICSFIEIKSKTISRSNPSQSIVGINLLFISVLTRLIVCWRILERVIILPVLLCFSCASIYWTMPYVRRTAYFVRTTHGSQKYVEGTHKFQCIDFILCYWLFRRIFMLNERHQIRWRFIQHETEGLKKFSCSFFSHLIDWFIVNFHLKWKLRRQNSEHE